MLPFYRHKSFLIGLMTLIAARASAQLGSAPATPIDERVKRALTTIPVKYEITKSGRYKVVTDLKSGRTHMVLINSKTSEFGNLEIREVFATGYKAPGGFSAPVLKRLLEYNSSVKFGGWYIEDFEGTTYAYFKVMAGADADGSTLKTIIDLVSRAADEIELELTQKDDF